MPLRLRKCQITLLAVNVTLQSISCLKKVVHNFAEMSPLLLLCKISRITHRNFSLLILRYNAQLKQLGAL